MPWEVEKSLTRSVCLHYIIVQIWRSCSFFLPPSPWLSACLMWWLLCCCRLSTKRSLPCLRLASEPAPWLAAYHHCLLSVLTDFSRLTWAYTVDFFLGFVTEDRITWFPHVFCSLGFVLFSDSSCSCPCTQVNPCFHCLRWPGVISVRSSWRSAGRAAAFGRKGLLRGSSQRAGVGCPAPKCTFTFVWWALECLVILIAPKYDFVRNSPFYFLAHFLLPITSQAARSLSA